MLRIDTRYGPAELKVYSNGGLYVVYTQPIVVNKVTYRSVTLSHRDYSGRLHGEVSGYRDSYGDISPAARKALLEELERLRLTYATPEARRQAQLDVLEHRVKQCSSDVEQAERKWHEALSALEAASAELAAFPGLDQLQPGAA